jgi:hypothetical protein
VAVAVVVLLLGAIGVTWLVSRQVSLQSLRMETVTAHDAAQAMQDDHFYADYADRILQITGIVASAQESAGSLVVALQTDGAYTLTCTDGQPIGAAPTAGAAVTLIAPGGTAQREASGVALPECRVIASTTGATEPSAASGPSFDTSTIAKADTMPLVTTINGQVPPGTPALVETSTQVLDLMRDGQEIRVFRDIREPGTRAPIHVHPFGGWTCVVSGIAVLYMEGAAPETAKAGECVDMPPLRAMSNANPGTEPSVLLDSFATPPGAPLWRIVEKGDTGLGDEFATGSATKTNN